MQRFIKNMKVNNKGSVLILGLIVIIGLAVLSTGFIFSVFTASRSTERFDATLKAINVAEAGLEYGIWEILHNGGNFPGADGWSAQTLPTTRQDFLLDNAGNSIGEYRITVSNPGAVVTLEAVAGIPNLTIAESIQRTVQISLVGEPLFEKAITGYDIVDLDDGVLVDSYDFALGPYGGANISDNGHVGTDSIADDTLLIGNAVTVKGDAYVGVGGTPADVIEYSGTGMITGSEIIAAEPTLKPSIQAPTGLPDRGTLNVGFFQTKTINSSGEYDDINVSFGGQLNITADATIYVKDDFNVVLGGRVEVQNNADVDIVVGDTFTVALFSSISNSSGDAANLAVFGLDTARFINMIGLCSVEGTFYAPNADFNMGLAVAVFGAVTADNINCGNLAGIHFDESLMTRTGAPSTGRAEVTNWHIK